MMISSSSDNSRKTRRPTITKIASSFPNLRVEQRELFEGVFQHWYGDLPDAWELMAQTQVKYRHMAWDLKNLLAEKSPTTDERMAIYKTVALDIGHRSLAQVLDGVDRNVIDSFVMASCTGYTGPTLDCLLARDFNLRSDLRRTFIGHMGCFAAFNVLKVAMDSLAARPQSQVLASCLELCSLHMRRHTTREQAVIHALFGDACTTVLISCEEPGNGVELIRSHTEQLYSTHEMMTWDVQADGFFMTLSPYVPFVIAEHIEVFMERLLGPEGLNVSDVKHWIIHPGGPKIIEFITKTLCLAPEQVAPTYRVLEQRGNCSSATVLLVLEELLASKTPERGDYGVMMAFGPGLTMESLLVRF